MSRDYRLYLEDIQACCAKIARKLEQEISKILNDLGDSVLS